MDLRSRMKHKDPKCDICSDSQKTRWHFHYSSNQIRESRQKLSICAQEGRKWFCPICFTNEPIELIPTQTRRIVLTDSSLYGVWKPGLPRPKDLTHFDIESIVGGRLQDLTTALMKNYLTYPARVEIIVLAGLNNIGDGDTAEQIIRYMDVMKSEVRDHSNHWEHDPPSYVSFCTVPFAPKYCSLYVPSEPFKQQAAIEWIPAPNFVNRYPEVKKLNDMIIQKNKEDNRDLKNVRVDYHGVKRHKNGRLQHKWDNKDEAAPVWAEVEVFRKLHFTIGWKMKLMNFISKCFKDNAAADPPSTESGFDSGESGIPPEGLRVGDWFLDSDRSTGAGATNL